MIGRTVLVVLLSVAGLSGQKQVVVPRHLTSAPGNQEGFAFGGQPKVVQQLFRVRPDMAGPVRELAFRRTSMTPWATQSTPAFTMDAAVGMSHSPREVHRPSTFLAENRGRDYVIVLPVKRLAFPAISPQPVPYPFTFRFVFDRPFVLRSNTTAMWEIAITRCDLSVWMPLDQYNRTRDPARFDPNKHTRKWFGRGCPSLQDNALQPLGYAAVGSALWVGKNPQVACTKPSVIFAGLNNIRWGPIGLPFDLTPVGAPGCFVNVSLDWPLPGFHHNDYWHFSALEVPDVPTARGAKLYLQGFMFGTCVNRARLTAGHAVELLIGPKPNVEASSVYSPWLAPQHTGVVGVFSVWEHAVFRLGY